MASKRNRRGRSKPAKLKVIWEPVVDPDQRAFRQAMAMLFGLGPEGRRKRKSTGPNRGEQLKLF